MRRLLRPGDRVLDAGANIGVFSLHAATCVGPTGRVWAVEAHPETAEILRRNVRENDALQIEVVNCALGANPGVAELFENLAANRGASSLIALDSSTRGQPVRVESIDRLWPDDRRLDLLKMDIEGSEVPALRGSKKILSRADAPWVICESSVLALPHADGEQQRAEIFHLLEAKGYRLFTGVLTKELTSRLRRVRAPEDMPRNDNVYGFTARHLRGVPQDMFVADDAPSGSASWSVI
jgi:FkbM family methyltransferase